MKHYFFFFPLLLLFSCKNSQLEATQAELALVHQQFQDLQAHIAQEGPLVHLVFFQLKANTDQAAFIQQVKTLAEIPTVLDLEVGPFKDLGDKRAMKEFGLLMTMSFKDSTAYKEYQVHPLHLALKEYAKANLAGPPVTYDFVKK